MQKPNPHFFIFLIKQANHQILTGVFVHQSKTLFLLFLKNQPDLKNINDAKQADFFFLKKPATPTKVGSLVIVVLLPGVIGDFEYLGSVLYHFHTI